MRPFFMSYVQGEDRGQAALLPAAIEDYVAADAPVRVIDAFVDGLDVNGLGFGRSVPAATGRPPYDPRGISEALHLGLFQRGALVAAPGAGMPPQCRGDVAFATAVPRLQDDCRFSARQRDSNHWGMPGLRDGVPGRGSVHGAADRA